MKCIYETKSAILYVKVLNLNESGEIFFRVLKKEQKCGENMKHSLEIYQQFRGDSKKSSQNFA